jgi:hypothetical protein
MALNLNSILRDLPGHEMSQEKADRVRILTDCLESGFTTQFSKIKSVDVDLDSLCVCVTFVTPYLTNSASDHALLPNLFRIADAVSISCVGRGEESEAVVVFSVRVWDCP